MRRTAVVDPLFSSAHAIFLADVIGKITSGGTDGLSETGRGSCVVGCLV